MWNIECFGGETNQTENKIMLCMKCWVNVCFLFVFSNFRARYCRYKYVQQQELRTVTDMYTQRQVCLWKPKSVGCHKRQRNNTIISKKGENMVDK